MLLVQNLIPSDDKCPFLPPSYLTGATPERMLLEELTNEKADLAAVLELRKSAAATEEAESKAAASATQSAAQSAQLSAASPLASASPLAAAPTPAAAAASAAPAAAPTSAASPIKSGISWGILGAVAASIFVLTVVALRVLKRRA